MERFFGDDPGCVLALPPSGTPYALCLYLSLPLSRNINFVSLSEKHLCEPALIEGRKILIVDDSIRTGGTAMAVKEKLMELNVKEIKTAVYDDFAGCADFAVRRQSYEEHLCSLIRVLEQFEL